ncbi:MAG: hypothetical protein A2Y15_07080 [Clostridiales bacterium GWF2_36_10]|nr:MAG: hypothetical protein A2Y15_07080 [Clostridiales bacterium GWF2_36_10]HAN21351.1 ECF transporter S component [Clostridiales bacterium]
MKINLQKLVYTALLLASGVLIPQLFHFGGPAAGTIFLPMHIPVLIGGLLLGPLYGAIIGVLSPALSFIIIGMPPVAILPFMIIELCIYGLVSGYLSTKTKLLYPVLISGMILSRAVYAGSLAIALYIFDMEKAAPLAVWTSFLKGLPGVAIQLVIIPPIVYALRRFALEKGNRKSEGTA